MESTFTLNCIRYDKHLNGQESFYFAELSTLEVTMLLDDQAEITDCKVYVESSDDVPNSGLCSNFRTVEQFNRYFINSRDFYIHDATLTFSDGSELSSHDDGEVTLQFGPTCITSDIVSRILQIKDCH